MLLGAIGGHDA